MYAFFRLLYLGSFAKSAALALGTALVPWAVAVAALPWSQATLVFWAATLAFFAVFGYRSWRFRREIVENVKPGVDLAQAMSSGDDEKRRDAAARLIAAIAADAGDDEGDEIAEPEGAETERVRAATRLRLEHIVTALAGAGVEIQEQRVIDFVREQDPDYGVPETLETLGALLPEQHLSLHAEVDEHDAHAVIVRALAGATAGAWQLEEAMSRKDEENGGCQVSLKEGGDWVHWRFAEYDHHLSSNFLQHTLAHGGGRAGGRFVICSHEDEFIDLLFLPRAVLDSLEQANLSLAGEE